MNLQHNMKFKIHAYLYDCFNVKTICQGTWEIFGIVRKHLHAHANTHVDTGVRRIAQLYIFHIYKSSYK